MLQKSIPLSGILDELGYHYVRALDTHCHFHKYHKTSGFDESAKHCLSDTNCAGIYHPGCTGSDYWSCKCNGENCKGFPGGKLGLGPTFQYDKDKNNHCVYKKM